MGSPQLRPWIAVVIVTATGLVACGNDEYIPPPPVGMCEPPPAPAVGDPDGHPQPLGAGPNEARAGRVTAADLPVVPSGLITWKPGDFVLANDKVALVIEDVGDSDLYDPWGGRPVGLARVEAGAMVEPNNFGELFLLTGRSTVMTEDVSVIADGSQGGPAIIRATGRLSALPFLPPQATAIFSDTFDDIEAAIDYELAPGSERVDIRMRYVSPRDKPKDIPGVLHAFMYTKRTPTFLPGVGFDDTINGQAYAALIDDGATSWAYLPGEGRFAAGLSVSGFVGAFNPNGTGFTLPACGAIDRVHASLVIGGPGLDGITDAVARVTGQAQREVTGTVRRGGMPARDVRVHAVDAATGAYYTRATTGASGEFSLHVPAAATVRLDTFRRGDALASATVAPGDPPPTIVVPAGGAIHVVVTDPGGTALPSRIQVFPAGGQAVPEVPASYGEPRIESGRLHVEVSTTGDVTLPAPVGSWEVVVSRGYEYELYRQTVAVTAGATVNVDATLDRSVATPGVVCGDFHIHTDRSNDAADTGVFKVENAVADGLELPVRSDHEWVGDFSAEIAALGVARWAKAIGSVELTSMEVWGHMGVFPLVPDPTKVNAGTPKWQTWPTPDQPTTPLQTLSPPAVFDTVRARAEAPVVIINHPRSQSGNANYFDYVGFDEVTGMVDSVSDWDTRFTLVEVFNGSGWQQNRKAGTCTKPSCTVDDWLALNRAGRKIFAVGSSDSHSVVGSPVGYPRTCVTVGTDDPRQVGVNQVRDQMAAGHHTVSGGIYVTAKVGSAGPGDTATGLGATADVDVEIQAATWVDVDAFDLVVDGQIVDTIPILPADADPGNPVIRWRGTLPVPVLASGGGFVLVAAYGDADLAPVHPGQLPFGVTNPIFLAP